MKFIAFVVFTVFTNLISIEAFSADDLAARRTALVDGVFERYRLIYEDFHRNPELSGKEIETSAKYAAELRNIGFDVTTGVGGYGVVGVLQNGAGPTIMVRADMDGLPIQEETGLSYASQNPGVMHACGHDLHMTSILGVAYTLFQMKDAWRGTLVIIGQPAEETVTGARAMIADGLFTRFPKPDLALGLHVTGMLPSTTLAVRPGFALAASDSVDVQLNGKDGHGSTPHRTVDPIVLGAEFVLKMNALVAREVDPLIPTVITVGSFHAGTRYNIIPASVRLQMTVRNYDEGVRAFLHQRIRDVAQELSDANRSPAPVVTLAEHVSATYNGPALYERLLPIFRAELGSANVAEMPPLMGGEDFSEYVRMGNLPGLFFFVGATNPSTPQPWPGNHTSKLAPDFANTWPIGVKAMSAAVISLMPAVNPSPVFPSGGRSGNMIPPMVRFTPAEVESILPHY